MTWNTQLHTDVTALDQVLRRDFRPGDPLERYIRAISEEAGEVSGAYNKWTDRRTDKPKGPDDVMHEMAQTIGCCFLAALHLGHDPAELLERTHRFMRDKAAGLGTEAYTVTCCAHEPESREIALAPEGES
jgi:hypothetical protein